ncbi:MAG: sugar phosphate nucleotidyltransferase [Candidatus Binatia bacterium]
MNGITTQSLGGGKGEGLKNYFMKNGPASPVRCGIVLAGGEGERLRPFINQLGRDSLPKQYVNFIGTRSMLEDTFRRAENLIPRERIFTVVSRDHLKYSEVRAQLSNRPKGTVIAQPENKDTGPGVLLPLMHLYKQYSNSSVAVFPSDHFIVEEDLFIAYVALALCVVERGPSRLVLLGMEPDGPEPEYGYILPGGKVRNLASLGVHKVRQFIEKPKPHVARGLVLGGGLWNSMVMVFTAKTLLDLAQNVSPRLCHAFQRLYEAIGTRAERDVVEETYRHLEPMNFSKGLLETLPLRHTSSLSVLPVRGVFWSDWGSGRRVLSNLKKIGCLAQLHGISENMLFRIWDRSQRDRKNRLSI